MVSAPAMLVRSSHSFLAIPAFTLLLLSAAPPPAAAQTSAPGGEQAEQPVPHGLWLTTPYPAFSAQADDSIDIDLALMNEGLPPQRVTFDVTGLPEGWQWKVTGGGHPVGAAIVPANERVDLALELTPPEDAETGTYEFGVSGQADGRTLDLPIALTLAESEPARLTMESELPALRGTVRSTFDFQVTVANEGPQEEVVNLLADAPAGFQVTFKERYGSQELTSLPLDPGASKDISVSVDPPQGVQAGQYPVTVAASGGDLNASTELTLDIAGSPELGLTGPGGRLSGDAVAGEARSFNMVVSNSGTAPAEQVSFSSNPPSGWNVTFNPEEIATIPPGESAEVAVEITPSNEAIAGDYMVSVNANGSGATDNADLRVTVTTSTLWGVTGLGVIAAAVMVLGFAVSRYGRR